MVHPLYIETHTLFSRCGQKVQNAMYFFASLTFIHHSMVDDHTSTPVASIFLKKLTNQVSILICLLLLCKLLTSALNIPILYFYSKIQSRFWSMKFDLVTTMSLNDRFRFRCENYSDFKLAFVKKQKYFQLWQLLLQQKLKKYSNIDLIVGVVSQLTGFDRVFYSMKINKGLKEKCC